MQKKMGKAHDAVKTLTAAINLPGVKKPSMFFDRAIFNQDALPALTPNKSRIGSYVLSR